jgi:carboxypeptidase C (cathepsin A)
VQEDFPKFCSIVSINDKAAQIMMSGTGSIVRVVVLACAALLASVALPVYAQRTEPAGDAEAIHLPADVISRQTLELPGRTLRFTATAGAIRLRDGKDKPLAEIAFVAYQAEQADPATRPVTFVFNGGPGMASAWLHVGAIGPWRVRLDPQTAGPSASPVPVANAETWLDFTDLVFLDPPGTGYSRILTTDADARRRLWSVGGDIDALALAIRKWLDQGGRMVSPKHILGESYGGFRGPRLVRKLQADEGVGIRGLVLLSPLLDAHEESGFADALNWVDLLPSEVAVTRARRGPVSRADMADVEAYAASDYLVDILRSAHDPAATDRLTARVADLTGLDSALVRRMHGRIDASVFLRSAVPGRVGSIYDGTVTRSDPAPRQASGGFPDPVLGGLSAPVTAAMIALYSGPLNWRPDMVYHLASESAFGSWDWGHGIGRPESLTALQAARSVDPQLRVLIVHGLFDLRTPYFGTARLLGMLPAMDGATPLALRVYPGGHMFYFDDVSRGALRDDARAMIRDDARAMFRDDARTLARDDARAMVRDGAGAILRDGAEAVSDPSKATGNSR